MHILESEAVLMEEQFQYFLCWYLFS